MESVANFSAPSSSAKIYILAIQLQQTRRNKRKVGVDFDYLLNPHSDNTGSIPEGNHKIWRKSRAPFNEQNNFMGRFIVTFEYFWLKIPTAKY